ncbi:MAG: hypothetical protein KatS3mg033_0567 [Thermonema sp.]|uniref:class I SAM-dependent methyltransferase n=1 Tax=Thermonema sp. TaxID=2231181 RepID=UPI0021DD3683|nr:methyltransferase domain-containing protein [Thermonema sp.]GIV38767.1 MAG: hypothetical protein KatS3mg033_0567 [Thermonema sp.]
MDQNLNIKVQKKLSFTYDACVYNTQSAEVILPIVFQEIKPKSVLDVGCGNGSWLKVCEKLGVENYLGLDGEHLSPNDLLIPYEKFKEQDLRQPFDLQNKYDLVLCLEVAEHLPEQAADGLVQSLTTHGDIILFSAAIPYQGGFMHINEQYPSYWQKKFESYGFYFYDLVRPQIWTNPKVQLWYRQNIFVVAHKDSFIAKKYRASSDFIDFVHPELYEKKAYQALRAELIEKGELGITLALKVLKNSILKKIWKK